MVTGSLNPRKKKNGRLSYQVVLDFGTDPNTGKRIRTYQTVNGTKKEAEALKNELLYQHMNGKAPIKQSCMRLEDWMTEWQKLYLGNLAETTKANYKQQIEARLNPYLGKIPIGNLTHTQVQKWVNTLKEEGLSGRTIKHVFLNLSAAMKKAHKLNKIAVNPCEDIVLPTIDPPKSNVYDKDEVEQLLRLAKGTDMELIIALEIAVGLRRGELVALKWSNVDLDKGIIHITENCVIAGDKVITKAPKSKAGIRDIWVGDRILTLLKEEFAKYDEKRKKVGYTDKGYVFAKDDGERYRPSSITQKWKRFKKEHNLREIRFHDLRHTCATMMMLNNVDDKTVQTRLGHSDIHTTLNTYAHCLPQMNKSAGDTMDKFFK